MYFPDLFLRLVVIISLLSCSTATSSKRSHRFLRRTSSSATQAAYLSAHNNVRSAHGTNPLQWSDTLAATAQQWASGCQLRHSDGSLRPQPYGENLAAGAGSFPAAAAVNIFTDDESQYNASHPSYSHFTQVVWKSTSELGCASAQCDGIFDPKFGKATYHVCLYNPAGNVIGQAPANVQV